MATASVQPDVYWRFNPQTRLVDIIADGKILETVPLEQAAQRVSFHRGELTKASGVHFVEASPYKRQNV